MDTTQDIIEAFEGEHGTLTEACKAAFEHGRDACPAFIEYIEAAAEANDIGRTWEFEATYWLCCMFAEWRETRAYRPMSRLFRCQPQYVDDLLGDRITEDCHRLMASVFDGDLSVLFDIIRDETAEEFMRGGMFEALTIIGLREPDHRDAIKEFAKDFASSQFAEATEPIWTSWAMCIGYLGFVELKPLVKHIFAAEKITDFTMFFKDFEKDLEKGLDPEAREEVAQRKHYSLWGDTLRIAMYSDGMAKEREHKLYDPPNAHNPLSSIKSHGRKPGRNDPCPCGSGRKYKKCCLGKRRSTVPAGG